MDFVSAKSALLCLLRELTAPDSLCIGDVLAQFLDGAAGGIAPDSLCIGDAAVSRFWKALRGCLSRGGCGVAVG